MDTCPRGTMYVPAADLLVVLRPLDLTELFRPELRELFLVANYDYLVLYSTDSYVLWRIANLTSSW